MEMKNLETGETCPAHRIGEDKNGNAIFAFVSGWSLVDEAGNDVGECDSDGNYSVSTRQAPSFADPVMDEANAQKRMASEQLQIAYDALCVAQNCITNVEGKGSADIYDGIADAYQAVAKLADKTKRMKATGLRWLDV